MIQKTVQRQSRKTEDVQEETAKDERNPKLAKDVDSILEEVDCCLAENEADTQKALKEQAQEEWYAIKRDSYGAMNRVQQQVWLAKYADLFQWCCGEPIFD
jgi:hypothetical protein